MCVNYIPVTKQVLQSDFHLVVPDQWFWPIEARQDSPAPIISIMETGFPILHKASLILLVS